MDDLLKIAKEIQARIGEISDIRSVVRERGQFKANAKIVYEKKLAVVMVSLKQGATFYIDQVKVEGGNVPVSNIRDIARGICYQERLDMEVTEADYKSAIVNISAVESQLNAWQSLLRYIDDA